MRRELKKNERARETKLQLNLPLFFS